MKFTIFTDRNHNYRKPMSDGLCKHLKELGHDVQILYDGNFWLSKTPLWKVFFSDTYKYFQNIKHRKKLYFPRFFSMLSFERKFLVRILDSDCLIVVDNCPNVFYNECLSRIEYLRKVYKGPIVNYDLHYLPNQGWYGMIKERDEANFGLERFDWYLPASLVTEYSVPRSIPKIYNCIGFDIQSPDLYPEQDDFLAVVDFPHKGWENERAIQIAALEATDTNYICLTGKYTRDEIRTIYRKCNLFFTSVRESFSLPVIEVQLCGGLIVTPYKDWLPAHFIDKDIYTEGIGNLGSNFRIYNNDQKQLEEIITKAKKSFNSSKNLRNFIEEYPLYYSMNDNGIVEFCELIKNKRINKDTHLEFEKFNQFISTDDRVLIR